MRRSAGASPLSDHELVAGFQSGDASAFDELVLRHQDLVFNLCLRFLGDSEEADDASQETFVKVFRALKDFRSDSSFTTWLYRIAVNTCKNRVSSLAHRMKKRSLSLDAERPDGNRVVPEPGDEKWSPAVLAERSETRKTILRAIADLPEDQRTVVVLADIEDRPYDEIAAVTGMNMGTVKSKLSRARQVLKERLSRHRLREVI